MNKFFFCPVSVLVEPGFGKDVSSDISLPKNSYDPLTIDTSLKHIPVSTGSPTLRNRYNSINERVQVVSYLLCTIIVDYTYVFL